MKKRIVFSVTNDLNYDQRMHKICLSLVGAGFEVSLIGRERSRSLPLEKKVYHQHRIKCWFERGKLFYLEYNLRLFFYLLFKPTDIYGIIDLDAALPVYYNAWLKNKPWTFDAHEYFSELEEVVTRPFVKAVWSRIEHFIVSRAKHAYTISSGYAKRFEAQYNTPFKVIRNIPRLGDEATIEPAISTDEKIIIYQGALNIGRGLEESILAMQHLNGMVLHIYGDGPIKAKLVRLISDFKLEKKVLLKGSRLPHELLGFTKQAYIGLTLFSDVGFHHRHSLANRFFDYMHANIPQLCMAYPEYLTFNQAYDIAISIPSLEVENIVLALNRLINDADLYERLRQNTIRAAAENHWQKESEILLEIYRQI